MGNEKTILITGSGGFAGRHLIELLREKERKAKFFCLDKKEADITSFLEVNKFIQKIKPDQIYHLAGFAKTIGDRQQTFKVNVLGSFNILKAVSLLGEKTRILLASSGLVYGDCSKLALETDSLNPIGNYAESKAEMEKVALGFRSKKLEIVISRAFNHTGPGQKLGFVIPDFAYQIAKIERDEQTAAMKVGDLSAKRDFLDVRDVVLAYHLIMERGKAGEIYNVARGCPYSIKEILSKLLSFSKTKIKVEIDKKRLRPASVQISAGNFQKIKKELGWQPSVPWQKTLRDVLNFWRKNVEQSEIPSNDGT